MTHLPPDGGVTKNAFYEIKCHIPHSGKWDMWHFNAYKGFFVTSISEALPGYKVSL